MKKFLPAFFVWNEHTRGRIISAVFILTLLISQPSLAQTLPGKWSAAKANAWYGKQGWLSGSNFQPSTAINQLEMFQAETFDTATISRELGWAEELGFNVMRVYLHHLLWTADQAGFKKRLDTYLSISARHKIKTLFVIFDDCWNDTAWVGKQPEPRKGIHNSGWVRDPGTMVHRYPDTLRSLEAYVKDIMTSFKDDDRILLWDLYNEPGNSDQYERSFNLLKLVFQWARQVNPSQPISAGLWNNGDRLKAMTSFMLNNSDVITYHNYSYIDDHKHAVDTLRKYGRPLICTEYMARRNGSLFHVIMPMLKKENVGAINWGFVSGKTNTIFAWDTPIEGGQEPDLWFHDIYRRNKTPFSQQEVEFIKKLRQGK